MSIPFINYFVHDIKTVFQKNSNVSRFEKEQRILTIVERTIGLIAFYVFFNALINIEQTRWDLFRNAILGVCSYDLCKMGHNVSKYINRNFFGHTQITHSTDIVAIAIQNTISPKIYLALAEGIANVARQNTILSKYIVRPCLALF